MLVSSGLTGRAGKDISQWCGHLNVVWLDNWSYPSHRFESRKRRDRELKHRSFLSRRFSRMTATRVLTRRTPGPNEKS
jgi:hypothetical protein